MLRNFFVSLIVLFALSPSAWAETASGGCNSGSSRANSCNISISNCNAYAMEKAIERAKQNCSSKTGREEIFDVQLLRQIETEIWVNGAVPSRRWNCTAQIRYACIGQPCYSGSCPHP